MASSVIFIGSPEKNPKNFKQTVKQLLCVNPADVFFRIFVAFVPPITKKYQKVYVDLQGPLLALLTLCAFVNYGYSFKTGHSFRSPNEAILIYAILMPILSFILCQLGSSHISLYEVSSLVGYSLYGHIMTLVISFLCFEERSNFFFFVCLIIFGGLSTLRVALVVLGTIKVPAVRLLVCSVISVINILFLIGLHFAYMHQPVTY